MARKPPSSSAVGRFLRLGGLMGRVGASVATERAVDFAFAGPAKNLRRTENLVRNARRVVETLGEMKGAVMKVGQMLSLHEGMLPPEVAEVLELLQKEAPRVPNEVMRYEVEGSLGARVEELFAEFEEEAFAAASIGQVHRARLHDGRQVAVKIQYPLDQRDREGGSQEPQGAPAGVSSAWSSTSTSSPSGASSGIGFSRSSTT